jgi:hypothetical protein
MYKIPLMLLILLSALIMFSTRVGATAASLPEAGLNRPNSPAVISRTSMALSMDSTARSGSSLSINSVFSQLSARNYPAALELSRSTLPATKHLGQLDGIAWNDLENPGYDVAFSHALVFPTSNESWAHYFIPNEDRTIVYGNNYQSNQPVPDANPAYKIYLSSRMDDTTMLGCFTCHDSSYALSLNTAAPDIQLLEQVQDDSSLGIRCTQCHIMEPVLMNLLIRGVE